MIDMRDHSDGADPAELLAAVERQKRARAGRGGAAALAEPDEAEMRDDLFDILETEEDGDGGPAPARRRPKRQVLADAAPGTPAPAKPERAKAPAKPAEKAEKAEKAPAKAEREKPKPRPKAKEERVASGPGLVTLGVHVGLRGVDAAGEVGRRLGLWGCAAVAIAVTVAALAFAGRQHMPAEAPVSGVRISYLAGPRLSEADSLRLVRAYPGLAGLRQGDDQALAALAAWLGEQPLVREVSQVRTVHSPDGSRRVVDIVLGLREPVLPAVLASGVRAWVDAEGRVLPGVLPAPAGGPRPILRGLEGGGAENLREALWLWSHLSKQLEPGLLSDIHCDDDLGLKGQRGIVLYTRSGSRLIWGRPADNRYGIEPAHKLRELVHSIRCQGDLSRIATINVRYKESYFTLR